MLIFGLLRGRLRAPRGVVVVAHSSAMDSSSALRCIPQAARSRASAAVNPRTAPLAAQNDTLTELTRFSGLDPLP